MQTFHYTGGGANRSVEEVKKLKRQYEDFDTNYIYQIFKDVLNLRVKNLKLPQNIGLPHISYIVEFENHKDLFYRGNLGWAKPETQLVKEQLVAELT